MNPLKGIRELAELVMSDAHVYGAEQENDTRRNIMLSSFFYSITSNLLGGVYLSGFCLAMGADANYVNTIILLFTLCNMAQIFAPLWMEQMKKRKGIIITMRAAAHIINMVVLPIMALAGAPRSVILGLGGVLLCVAQLLITSINPGIQAWHIGCIPMEKRLGYFSFFNVANVIITFLSLFFLGIFADFLTTNLGSATALPLLRLFGTVLAALDIFYLTRVKEHGYTQKEKTGEKFTLGKILRAYPNYLKIILVASLWSFCINFPSQYFNIYLLEDLNLGYTFINSVNLYNIVACLLFTGVWKRVIRKYSISGALFWGILLYSLHTIALLFTTQTTSWLFPVAMIYGFNFSVGNTLCFSMLPYAGLPEESRTVFLALYNTCVALATFPGVLIGRGLFMALSSNPLLVNGSVIAPARILIIIMGALLVLCAFVTRKLLRNIEI